MDAAAAANPSAAAAAAAAAPAAASAPAAPLTWVQRAASINPRHHSHAEDEGTGRAILWSLILVVAVCQAGVFFWKRYHVASFNLLSLVAMWLIPAGWVLVQGDLHPLHSPFLYVWLAFTLLMAALLAAVHQRTLAEATPGVVYGVLEQVYLQCMWVSSSVLTGIMVLVMVPPLGGLAPPWALSLFLGAGLYAVYFAVLARDLDTPSPPHTPTGP
jgi:RING finger protein 121